MKAIVANSNSTNGGLIAVRASHCDLKYTESSNLIDFRHREAESNLRDIKTYNDFVTSTLRHREDLIEVFHRWINAKYDLLLVF